MLKKWNLSFQFLQSWKEKLIKGFFYLLFFIILFIKCQYTFRPGANPEEYYESLTNLNSACDALVDRGYRSLRPTIDFMVDSPFLFFLILKLYFSLKQQTLKQVGIEKCMTIYTTLIKSMNDPIDPRTLPQEALCISLSILFFLFSIFHIYFILKFSLLFYFIIIVNPKVPLEVLDNLKQVQVSKLNSLFVYY